MMKEENQIEWELLIRKILNRNTPEEEILFQAWYGEDEQNRIYFEKAKSYINRYYSGNEERIIDKEEAWNEFLTHTRKVKSGENLRIRMLKYAAIIAIPLLCSWLAYTFIANRQESEPQTTAKAEIFPGETKAVLILGDGKEIILSESFRQDTVARENNVIINHLDNGLQYNSQGENNRIASQNTIITPRGGEYQVTLSDGTRITLNAESKLIFPVEFPENTRKVQLIGEAYFDVTHNEKAPFIVETQAGQIKVLGTIFNISAYSNDDIIQTTLVKGSVSFIKPEYSEGQIIKPGEQITYHKANQTIQIQQVNTDIYCSWREGMFILEAQRLEDMMKRIARWYDVEVFFQNQEARDLIFTGDLEKYEKCDVILKIIELSTNVRFVIKGRSITVMMRY